MGKKKKEYKLVIGKKTPLLTDIDDVLGAVMKITVNTDYSKEEYAAALVVIISTLKQWLKDLE